MEETDELDIIADVFDNGSLASYVSVTILLMTATDGNSLLDCI